MKKFGKRRGTSYEYEKTSRALDRDTSGELADDDDDEGSHFLCNNYKS